MQNVLYIVGIALLFLLVYLNNKRNVNKLRNKKRRNFRENYESKKQNR